MSDTSQNNKRIAKNTLLLYIRMFMTMGISIYTSRVVLQTLGVVDYGIYNVVGGFVSLFAVISGTMTSATQRFLSFEIGKNGRIKELFSTTIIIHIILAIIVLAFAESFGIWFINTKMTIPEHRIVAVNWVYQLSLLTFLISVISVPYNAAIIAYEKMSAFAYISIFEAICKLLIVYLISISTYDKLIVYAILIAALSIVLRIIYGVYVKNKFIECTFKWKIDNSYCKLLFSYISWNFIGSIASILKDQGINVLLNIFFGATVNASRGIASQVLKAVSGFVTNFQLAMNPQIIKNYASGEVKQMFQLVFRGSKFSYLMMLIFCIPLILYAPLILKIWLVEVPPYTVIFLRLILFTTLIDSLSHTLITSVHASGKVKWYQIINGSILLLTLPIVYMVCKKGGEPYAAFIVSLVISFVCLFVRMMIIRTTICFPMKQFVIEVLLKVIIVSVISFGLTFLIRELLPISFLSLCFNCICSTTIVTVSSYYMALSLGERAFITKLIKNKLQTFI